MTGYERAKNTRNYYIDDICEVCMFSESNDETDISCYKSANYYSDLTVAENNSRADSLMRQLRRYAVEHNECEFDWKDSEQEKFFIGYSYKDEKIYAIGGYFCCKGFGEINFTSSEIANQAIEEFKDELLWYFTEYKDHIVNTDKKAGCEYCGNAEKLNAMAELEFEFCPKCGRALELTDKT